MSRVLARTSMISERQYVERRDQDDDAEDHEHGDALDLERLEQRRRCAAASRLETPVVLRHLGRELGKRSICDLTLSEIDSSAARPSLDAVAHQQQRLRILHRHDHVSLVEIVDADLEGGGDAVADDARRGAERGRFARLGLSTLIWSPTPMPRDSASLVPITTLPDPGVTSARLPALTSGPMVERSDRGSAMPRSRIGSTRPFDLREERLLDQRDRRGDAGRRLG